MLEISSNSNPRIKDVIALQEKSAVRRKNGRFVIEGIRETEQALAAGYRLQTLFFTPELEAKRPDLIRMADENKAALCRITASVYQRLAYRESTEGAIAVAYTPEQGLDTLKLSAAPLIIVLESVEKPGNLGAILRTADAVHADAVLVCDPLTDLYNPNIIRSSLGGVFSVPLRACTSENAASWLKQHQIRIFTAQLQDSELYYDTDMTCGCALVMGTEATGLTDFWRQQADAHIRIPMLGRIDSLNVSVSTAILCYEAIRQRHGKR